METKKRLVVICLLWVLAVYCGFTAFDMTQILLSLYPYDLIFINKPLFVATLIFFIGCWFYVVIALSTQRMSLNKKKIMWFQIFSGVFAGSCTNILWSALFSEEIYSPSSYQIIGECLVFAAAFMAAKAVARILNYWSLRLFFGAFIVSSLFFAVLQAVLLAVIQKKTTFDFVIYSFVVFIVVQMFRFFSSSIPSTSTSATLDFKKRLPEGFGYAYCLDETGYGVNVKENKLYVLSKGKTHIYERESVRRVKSWIEGASEIYGAVGLSNNINAGLKNRSMKKNAYKNSGIFVEVADIDNPVLQIMFSNEAELSRSFEILQQFLDGTLMDYEEYLNAKQKTQ